MNDWCRLTRTSKRKRYETISRGFHESLRSEGRAPRGASTVFEALAIWRSQPVLASVAYYNLLGAAMTVPLAIATGLGAWRWQLQGAVLKGNLRLHLICALTSASLIFVLCWMRSRLRAKGISPGIAYFAMALLALAIITFTGHLGGILSGVETP